jgi:putative protein-disulfide isomerase
VTYDPTRGSDTPTLVYVHDPMCSWCWGFAPVFERLMTSLPESVTVRRLLGGLAPDSDAPMHTSIRDYVQDQWRRIQREIPGTEFNFDFWDRCAPRRSTYPACRAVIAARSQDTGFDPAMTRAIQRAYYLEARNPSETDTLIDLARDIGLDVDVFARDLLSVDTDRTLRAEIRKARELEVWGFPSLVMVEGGTHRTVSVHYTDHRPMLAEIDRSG